MTPYQAIVVASLVEREARVDEDRGKVARVIYNRLDGTMPLQIDATVLYAIEQKTGVRKDSVLLRDLEIDSPYNTYKIAGPAARARSPTRAGVAGGGAGAHAGTWIYYVLADAVGAAHLHRQRGRVQPAAPAVHRQGALWLTARVATTSGWQPGPDTRLAAVIGVPGPALTVAGHPQRRLPGAGPRLGLRGLRGGARRGGRRLGGMRALGSGGLSVTIPHKEAAAAAVDELSATARALGAVNTIVVHDGGVLFGENTDGAGFLASLGRRRVRPSGRRCVVRGAGGAARAVVCALAVAGADEVVVVPGATPAGPRRRRGLAGVVGRVGDAADVGRRRDRGQRHPARPGAGRRAAGRAAVRPGLLGPGQLVVDLVPPPITPLMQAAAGRGAAVAGGLGMLVHQGALAFELWTGRRAAARRHAGRQPPPPGRR